MEKRDFWAMGLRVAALAAVTALAAPAHAGDELVINGGFEQRDFSGWIAGGDDLFNSVQCPMDNTVFSGSCSAMFGSVDVSSISQSIQVGGAGKTWNLSFAYAIEGGDPSSFSVMFGGTTLLSLSSPAPAGYTLYQFSGLTTGENMTLSFSFTNPASFAYLDGVSVTAVPEPASLGLMAAGLAGLLVARRRKA